MISFKGSFLGTKVTALLGNGAVFKRKKVLSAVYYSMITEAKK